MWAALGQIACMVGETEMQHVTSDNEVRLNVDWHLHSKGMGGSSPQNQFNCRLAYLWAPPIFTVDKKDKEAILRNQCWDQRSVFTTFTKIPSSTTEKIDFGDK